MRQQGIGEELTPTEMNALEQRKPFDTDSESVVGYFEDTQWQPDAPSTSAIHLGPSGNFHVTEKNQHEYTSTFNYLAMRCIRMG